MFNFIVLGGSSVIVTAVLRAIRSFTNEKIIVFGDHDTQSLRWSFLFKKHIAISLEGPDDDKCISMLNALAKSSPNSVLIPCDCDAIRMTNRMSDRLAVKTIPFPDTKVLNMFDDKWLFYAFCQRHGLDTPDTIFIGTKDQCNFDTVAGKVGLPFILKPSNEAGSKGIEVIRSKAHYEQTVSQNPRYVFDHLIAQRYIDGTDIDVSLYSINGKLTACAIQQSANGRIRFLTNPYLTTLAEILCTQTAYHGVMHIDARIDRHTGKVYLIESNPRFWASLTAAALCGLNFLEEIVTTSTAARQGVRQLTAGSVSIRPPFIEPSNWAALLFDTSARGRMYRAMTFDLPSLFSFLQSVSLMMRSKVKKRFSRQAPNDAHILSQPAPLDLSLLMPGTQLPDDDAVESDTENYPASLAVPDALVRRKNSPDAATLS